MIAGKGKRLMGNTLVQPPSTQTALPRPVAAVPGGSGREVPKHSSWWGKLFVALVVVLAFGAGWLLAGRSSSRREKEALPPETGVAGRDASSVMVTIEPVTVRPVKRTIEGVGTLHGFEEVSVSARVEGRVRKLRFDVADRLEPGAVLLEIDPTDYELSVQQAERALQVELAKLGLAKVPDAEVDLGKVPSVMQARTRMENAQSREERGRKMAATRAITPEDLGTLSSDYRVAQAEYANQVLLGKVGLATIRMKQTALAIAQQQLEEARVRVPTPTRPVPGAVGGVTYAVTQRMVSEGTLVRPGTEVCKLVINQTLKLRVPVPERYGSEVRMGQKAEVSTAAFPRAFAGAVARINPAVEPTTRTFEVEIQVPNPRGELKPGSFAKAAILTRLDAEATTVPLTALVNFAGINKIFLAENGRAKAVEVTPGMQTTEWVEITTPALPRGARVITSGQTALASDTPVAVRAAPTDTPSPAPPNARQEAVP